MRAPAMAAVVVGVALASGCTSTTPQPPRASVAVTPPTMQDPTRLVGVWRVEGAPVVAGTDLVIGNKADGGIALVAKCGLSSGSWRANALGGFVAELDGFDPACGGHDAAAGVTPTWLRAAVAYRTEGRNVVLLDDRGHVVAKLVPARRATIGPNASPDFGVAVLTPALRAGFAAPMPLPSDVRPATAQDLLGRWVPLDRRPVKAYVEFGSDAAYSGSDGCNGAGGRYIVGSDGVILATQGVSTLIGCNNSPLASWPAMSGRVGLRDGLLAFYDPRGHLLGEARRA